MAISQFVTRQYKDRSISSGKIALSAVITDLLADSSVTALKVANDAVITAKILDLNVTNAKLAEKVISSNKIGDAAIIGGAQFAATMDADGKTFSGAATFSSPLTIADATASAHAVNKGQLDTAVTNLQNSVSALGNAFNYVSTVIGGADSANAYQLNDLTQKDSGDYYKVATSGYFKVGTGTAFFANANDGLVWNTSNGVDIIDNTNSTVAGTTDFISVTGSPDTGYQLDLDLAFKNRMTAAETKIGTVALTTTAADLSAAVNEHDAEIGVISTLVTTDKTSLVAAINELANSDISSCYMRETPSGDLDGSNTIFALSATPQAITVQVYLEGQLLEPTDDYTLSGSNITMVTAPQSTDKLRVVYFKQ